MLPKALIRGLQEAGADANLVKALTADYASRYWIAPCMFTAAAGFQLAANGGTQALNASNPDTSGFALITHQCYVSTGPFLVQLTPTDIGAGLFTGFVQAETLLSILDQPWKLPVPILLRGSDSLRVDVINDNGAVANDVQWSNIGYRLIPRSRQC